MSRICTPFSVCIGKTSRRMAMRSCTTQALVVLQTERHASAAILVVRLQHEILASVAHVFQQAESFSVARGLAVREQPRPWDVPANQFALRSTEERSILLVGKHSEKSLLVRNLAGKRIGHANRAGTVSVHQGRALSAARDDIVNQNAAINQINALTMRREPPFGENQVARIC